jgi:hypothetical protein
MTTLVDLNEVRRVWDKRYGPAWTRGAMKDAWPGKSGMALDAMPPRRARDQDPPDDTSGQSLPAMEKCKTFLKNRLSPADYARFEQMVQAAAGGGSEEEPDDYNPNELDSIKGKSNEDAGEPDIAKPDLRKEYASDAQPRRNGHGYFDMFPSNRKVNTFDYGG